MTEKKSALSTRDLAYISIAAALIAVCAWISIPAAVPFTMQTFGMFFALSLLVQLRLGRNLPLYGLVLTAIVTDRGIVRPPFDVNLKKLFAEPGENL